MGFNAETWQGEVAEGVAFAVFAVAFFGAMAAINAPQQELAPCDCEPRPPVQYAQEREVE